MNGVLRKIAEYRQADWDRHTVGQVLTVDLVVPPEQLFTESLDGLKQLDLAMLEVISNQGWALKAQGAAYELSFNEQRRLLTELIAFEQSHPQFSPLADGRRLYDFIKAHGNELTRTAMHTAWIAIKSLDDIKPIEPPVIVKQPPETVFVVEGEPAVFSVEATGTGLSYRWFRDRQKLLGEERSSYTMHNTDWWFDRARFSVLVSNSAGEVRSREAVLRIVKK